MTGAADLYGHMPILLQNLACSAHGLREGRVRAGSVFRPRYDSLVASDFASQRTISEYRDVQVARLIKHAYETVPYYRRVMDERGILPRDVTSVAELARMPLLHKEDVVAHFDEMLSGAYNVKELRSARTSGTTGTALRFYTTDEALAFQWAVWWRHRARFGVRPGTWHLNFTIRPVVPAAQTRPPYWRWNYPMRQALVSMQHVRPAHAAEVAAFIDRHGFDYFVGYPSVIHEFVRSLQDCGLTLSRPPSYVFLGAEGLEEYQRDAIVAATGACISDQYGFAEGCGNASRCECGSYHEDWEFGVLECHEPALDADGARSGKVLATGFANQAFPFIRYVVGDSGTWSKEGFRCPCGRESAVLTRIEGRNEDYIITPEGARVMRFGHLFKETDGIREAQVVQREADSILIRYVPRAGFSSADEDKVRRQVHEWVSAGMRVEFEAVPEIPRSASGKFKPVVSELGDRS